MRAWELAEKAIEANAVQRMSEYTDLIQFLLDRPAPRAVIEIGTYHGGTLFTWCQIAAPDAVLVSIDLPGDDPFGGERTFSIEDEPRLRSYARPGQRIVFLRADSHAPETLSAARSELPDGKADLVFIDGDHSYSGAYADWNDYRALVAPGGVVIFHDILDNPDPIYGVHRLWTEIKAEGWETYEFVGDLREPIGALGDVPEVPQGGIGLVELPLP